MDGEVLSAEEELPVYLKMEQKNGVNKEFTLNYLLMESLDQILIIVLNIILLKIFQSYY